MVRVGDKIKVTKSQWSDYKKGTIGKVVKVYGAGEEYVLDFTTENGTHIIHNDGKDDFIVITSTKPVIEILNKRI